MRQNSNKHSYFMLNSKRRRKVGFHHELEAVNPTVFSSAFAIGQISADIIRIALSFEQG